MMNDVCCGHKKNVNFFLVTASVANFGKRVMKWTFAIVGILQKKTIHFLLKNGKCTSLPTSSILAQRVVK